VVQTCTKHSSSSLGPEPFAHKKYIARLWHGNLTAILDFACAKGPSIVADSFDMVIICHCEGGGLWFEPRVPLFCWVRTFVTWDCVVVGNVVCALSFNSCYIWHTAYIWGYTHGGFILHVRSTNSMCILSSLNRCILKIVHFSCYSVCV